MKTSVLIMSTNVNTISDLLRAIDLQVFAFLRYPKG